MNALKRQIAGMSKSRRKRRLTKHLSSNIRKRIGFLLSLLLVLVAINTLAMVMFEEMSWNDGLWMSLTTITTVGYGDLSPSTSIGRLITVLSLYAFAISVLTLLISEIVEWRLLINDKKRRGFWVWKTMMNHIQIINSPNVDPSRYLQRLIGEINATSLLNGHPVKLLSRKFPDGLPPELTALKLLHRTGAAEDFEMLNSIGLDKADYIILLARDPQDTVSDSITFDVLMQIRSINSPARVIAEAVADHNHQRFLDAGADVVLRPIRAYPELVVRAMVNPGTEKVIEDLLNAQGDSLYREDVVFEEIPWIELVTQSLKCGVGTPIAYTKNGQINMHPDAHQVCSGDGLIVLSKQHSIKNVSTLKHALGH